MKLIDAVKEYEEICKRYGSQSEEDIFLANELAKFIYEKTNNSEFLIHYIKDLDPIQKIKVLKKHPDKSDPKVSFWLGQLYYDGDEKIIDYKKAFESFTIASKQKHTGSGNIDDPYHQVYLDAKLYLAKMYKNGQYVKQDYEMYKKLVDEAYESAKDLKWYFQTCDVLIEKAKILIQENKHVLAKQILLKAREDLETTMYYTDEFDDNLQIVNTMLINNNLLDDEDIDYSIISELLNKPIKLRFKYGKDEYIVESRYLNDELLIVFEDQYFRTINDFYKNAYLSSELCYLYEIIKDTHNWEVVYEESNY